MSAADYANGLLEKGLSIIPITMPSKQPTVKKWKPYQNKRPEIGELSYNGCIGLICGKVSGNVECLDVDVKHDRELPAKIKEVFGPFLEEIWKSTVVQKTASGGYHFIYRCEEIGGNKKLAQKENKEVILETRGEGGYIVIAPTPGYEILHGSFDEIPFITTTQRNRLFELASQLNEYWIEEKSPVSKRFIENVGGITPWDDFNMQADIGEILQQYGWSYVSSKGPVDFYKRPGTTDSVHSGSYHKEKNLFYVYTSSTQLEPNKAYPPYALYTWFEHAGDFSASAKALIAKGLGKQPQQIERIKTEEGEQTVILTRIKKIENWLTDHYDFRRNVISDRLYYRKKNTPSWVICNENDVWRDLQHNVHDLGKGKRGGELSVPINDVCNILESSFVPDFNPFEDYFNNLPSWDGRDHITALANHISTDDQDFWEQQFKKVLVRMVACTLYRIVNRIVVTLVGEAQETGKSTFIRFLCPPALREYYKEEPLLHDKDSEIALSENFIWNLEELDDLNKKQISEMKAIISRESVKHRRAYARYEKSMPRIVNFWGSTNKTDFLTDTQNTRWMCFNVLSINHDYNNNATDVRNINIDQVWAQAYHLYKTKFNYALSADDRTHRDTRNQMFESMPDEKQLIMRYFRAATAATPGASFMANYEILEHLNMNTSAKTRISVHNIGRSMKQLGFKFEYKRVNGKNFRGYWLIKNSDPSPFDQEAVNQQKIFDSEFPPF